MQDGKFHPHSEYKKGTRKSRDQKAKTIGVRMARGDNNAEILKNRLITFNNFHKPEVEYGTFGGGMGKALIIKDTQTPLSPNGITKSEAIDYLSAIDDYIDNLKETVDGTNEKILTLQPTGKKVTITGSGDVIRNKRDLPRDLNYIHSYVISDRIGIPIDGYIGTYTVGTGKNAKIVGYKQGQTFSKESIQRIDPKIKEYDVTVMSDPEGEYGKVYATTDAIATRVADDLLKENTPFVLTRIDKKFIKVNK